MNKYEIWLNAVKGRRSELAKELGVRPASFSLLGRDGGRTLPPAWIPTIVRFSNGALRHSDLLPISSQAVNRMWKAGLLPRDKDKLNLALQAMGRSQQKAKR